MNEEETMAYEKRDDAFSDNLLRLLEERGMHMTDLDLMCGLFRGCTSSWVCGRHKPTLGKLRKLKWALGCTWDELLGS